MIPNTGETLLPTNPSHTSNEVSLSCAIPIHPILGISGITIAWLRFREKRTSLTKCSGLFRESYLKPTGNHYGLENLGQPDGCASSPRRRAGYGRCVKETVPTRRERDCSRFGRQILYPNDDYFFSDFLAVRGLHTVVHAENRPLDFYLDYRGSTRTLVSLHGRIPPRCTTLPYLSGRRLAEALGVNLIAVVDPTSSLGTIPCSWYLGDREIGYGIELLSPYIRAILAAFRSETEIFFGGSGGAFAAVNFLQTFPQSSAVITNPRLELTRRPHPDFSAYYRDAHGATTRTARHRVFDSFIQGRQPGDVSLGPSQRLFIYQNNNDVTYKNGQVIPFLEERSESSNIFVQLFDGPSGHTPPSIEDLKRVINGAFEWIEGKKPANSGFLTPAEFLANRPDT